MALFSSTSSSAPGLRRATWSSIQERDLDLMLLDLLHTSPDFRQWLLRSVAADVTGVDAEGGFLGAWHSVNTPNGESDLEAEWQRENGTRLTLLIEDKLGAAFQPDQGLRYRERALAYGTSGRSSLTRVVLVAPAGYPARDASGSAPFERHVSIEAVMAWCEAGGGDAQSAHRAAFLRQALDRTGARPRSSVSSTPSISPTAARGGKPQFPEFYAEINNVLRSRIAPVGGVTGTSGSSQGEWVYFAFPRTAGIGVSLRWRLRDHWVEIVYQLKKIRRQDVEDALLDEPLPGAAITGRGTSEVVVWLPTAEVDAFAPAAPQRTAIEQALDSADGLARWYMATRARYE